MVTSGPDDLGEAVAGLGQQVEQLAATVQVMRGLPERVEELAQIVVRVANATTPAEGSVGDGVGDLVLSWLDLDDTPHTARAVLADLTVWMRRVLLRYPDTAAALPECWAWHPNIVEELLWLQQAWQTAYHSTASSPALAGDWHDRARPGVIARIKTTAGTCSIENHTPGGDHHHPAPDTPPTEDLDAAADWWATSRDTPPAVQRPERRMNGSRR